MVKQKNDDSIAVASKDSAISVAVSEIEKMFGKGSIMRLGDKKHVDVDVIPTGALSLDVALGVGGVPRGRIIEIYGPESSGKTTLALHIVAEAQKKGGRAAYIDAEHALDPVYASNLGVNIKELYISQPDYGEQALEILEMLVRSGAMDVIVIDSVAALTPKAEIEGNMGDTHMGLLARLMSQALRKLTAISAKTGTTVIFLNQIRLNIGVFVGNPETTTGGKALKFYSSVRMDIRQREKITEGDEIVGHLREVKVVKNKVAPPFRRATFAIIYPQGMDKESSIIDAAIKVGVLEKKGAWISMEGKQIAQGQSKMIQLLKEDTKFCKDIEKKVREKIK
ncbi:recombinase RecA [Candidatus Dojkabacteria bacterium]|nr:recombinase RecA [Candidatus Dojkabacteria bacterium]